MSQQLLTTLEVAKLLRMSADRGPRPGQRGPPGGSPGSSAWAAASTRRTCNGPRERPGHWSRLAAAH